MRRRHKTLQEMAELFGIFLVERLQLTAEDAATLGDELVDLVHRHYSGQSLYFPRIAAMSGWSMTPTSGSTFAAGTPRRSPPTWA